MAVVKAKTGRRKKATTREVCEVIQRGPNWLFLRLTTPIVDSSLADRLWNVARQHFTSRLLIELDPDESLDADLGEELHSLSRRLHEIGGDLRLCGLPEDSAHDVLATAGCDDLLHESSRRDAVVGDSVCVMPKPR